jgi:hypothetical protein
MAFNWTMARFFANVDDHQSGCGYVCGVRAVVIGLVLMFAVSVTGCGGKSSPTRSKSTTTGSKHPNKPAHY